MREVRLYRVDNLSKSSTHRITDPGWGTGPFSPPQKAPTKHRGTWLKMSWIIHYETDKINPDECAQNCTHYIKKNPPVQLSSDTHIFFNVENTEGCLHSTRDQMQTRTRTVQKAESKECLWRGSIKPAKQDSLNTFQPQQLLSNDRTQGRGEGDGCDGSLSPWKAGWFPF